MDEIITELRDKFSKILGALREDLAKLRTGRANPSIIEDLSVEAYGERLRLKELGAIRTSGPRQLFIEPWDRSIIENIEKTLLRAELGVSPVVEESGIRLTFPSLTSERRRSLMAEVGRRIEAAKNQVRYARQEAREQAEQLEGSQGEDFVFRLKEEIEKEVENVGKELEEIRKRKEEEIAG